MQIAFVLTGSGGELDRRVIETSEQAASENIADALSELAHEWTLNPGDTIAIVTVEG